MGNLLFDFATLTIGPYSLVVGAVLLTISLNLDFSYVDDAPLINTTERGIIWCGVSTLAASTCPVGGTASAYRTLERTNRYDQESQGT